jgi:ferredoxin
VGCVQALQAEPARGRRRRLTNPGRCQHRGPADSRRLHRLRRLHTLRPNEAIAADSPIDVIDALRCTECAGVEDVPQCMLVCPVGGIVPNPDVVESKEGLLAKY